MRAVLWKRRYAGSAGDRGHCAAFFTRNICRICMCGVFYAGTDDACVYERSGTDSRRRIVSAMDERLLSVLGDYGSISGSASKRRQGSYQYGDECAGVFGKCVPECGIYLWTVWRSKTGSYGRCNRDFSVKADRAGGLLCGIGVE